MSVELKGKLEPGEKIIAQVVEQKNEKVIFQRQDGSQFALQSTNKLEIAIDMADEFKPILKLERLESGKLHIEELDEWPKSEK